MNPNDKAGEDDALYISHEQDIQNKIEAEKAYVDKWANSSVPSQPVVAEQPPEVDQTVKNEMRNEQVTPVESFTPPQTPPVPIASYSPALNQEDEVVLINNEASHEYANISLVMAFVSPISGLILAFIALKKAKKAGVKNETAKISILVNFLFLVLFIGLIIFILTPSES